METLTKHFESRVAGFLQRTGLTPTEFGERAIGDRTFCGDLRRGRSPRLATADRILAFMEAYDRAAHQTRGSAGSESLGVLPRQREGRSDDTSGRAGEGRRRPLRSAVSKGPAMKLHYYPETDSLYVELKAGAGAETREVWDGLNVDLDTAGNLIGFDIDHVSRRCDLSTIETEALPVHSARVS